MFCLVCFFFGFFVFVYLFWFFFDCLGFFVLYYKENCHNGQQQCGNYSAYSDRLYTKLALLFIVGFPLSKKGYNSCWGLTRGKFRNLSAVISRTVTRFQHFLKVKQPFTENLRTVIAGTICDCVVCISLSLKQNCPRASMRTVLNLSQVKICIHSKC